MHTATGFSQLLSAGEYRDGSHVFTIGNDWLQGRTAFGGLQAAMALQAMRALVPATVPLRVLQTTFIGPVPPGTVSVRARVLRTGKSVIHAEARIGAGEDTACLVVGVFGSARESAIHLDEGVYPPLPAADTLRPMPQAPGITPSFLRHFELRWAQGGVPFSASAQASTRIYLKLREEPVGSEAHLVALADAIPTPGLSLLRQPSPASSLTWTLELLRDDFAASEIGWWLMDASVSHGRHGYLSQSALLWDAQRRAVALSRQSVTVFG